MKQFGRPRKYSNILTKEFLIENYVNKKLNCKAIANMIGNKHHQTVIYYLDYYGIPHNNRKDTMSKVYRPSKYDKILTKEILIEKYINQKMSKLSIAKEVNCPNNTITQLLKKHKIKMRTPRESYDLKKGKNSYLYGRTVIFLNVGKYKNVFMRSRYELNFAKWCDLSCVEWKYEPKIFDLGDTTYRPDFYLPEFDCYIETKGYVSPIFINKLEIFNNMYPDIFLIVLTEKELKEMSIIDNSLKKYKLSYKFNRKSKSFQPYSEDIK